MRRDVQRIAGLTGPRGVVSTWIGVFHDSDHPDRARGMLDFAGQLQAQGVRNYPQVSPRTLDIHVNWDGGTVVQAGGELTRACPGGVLRR